MKVVRNKFSVLWATGIASLLLVLIGCAPQQSVRPPSTPTDAQATNAQQAPAEVATGEEGVAIPAVSVAVEPTEPRPGVWQRIRAGLTLYGCEYNDASLRWAQRFSQGPARFAASLQSVMPFIHFVLDEVEQRSIPTEFVLLPYLESHYFPFPGRGNGPAGVWQFMPATGRLYGLRQDGEYDGRLDMVASTRAALDLLAALYAEFGDWRLANMAYNAGEYRLKGALRRHTGELDAFGIARLKLSPITHAHLAKLFGLACIVRDPGRFGVSLPEPIASPLVVVETGGAIDLELAASLAQIETKELRRYNPGLRRNAVPLAGPHKLLLPTEHAAQFSERLALVPSALRQRRWQNERIRRPQSLQSLATERGCTANVLAAINALGDGAELRLGQSLLLPSSGTGRSVLANVTVPSSPAVQHRVRPGDTLWEIARSYGTRVENLLNWNGLSAETLLRPGQILRVVAPDPSSRP